MGKSVGIDQSHAIMAILATNVDWINLNGEFLQEQVLGNPKEAGRQFTAFLRNGARMITGDLKIATVPFDPVSFIGNEWKSIPEEQDKQSHALTEVNFSEVEFVSCLCEKETSIDGEEKLRRLKQKSCIRYGATVFMGLWQNYQSKKENSILEHLYREKEITYMDFFGDVFLAPYGHRNVLYLCRDSDGKWGWGVSWLDNDWHGRRVSVVSSQVEP